MSTIDIVRCVEIEKLIIDCEDNTISILDSLFFFGTELFVHDIFRQPFCGTLVYGVISGTSGSSGTYAARI